MAGEAGAARPNVEPQMQADGESQCQAEGHVLSPSRPTLDAAELELADLHGAPLAHAHAQVADEEPLARDPERSHLASRTPSALLHARIDPHACAHAGYATSAAPCSPFMTNSSAQQLRAAHKSLVPPVPPTTPPGAGAAACVDKAQLSPVKHPQAPAGAASALPAPSSNDLTGTTTRATPHASPGPGGDTASSSLSPFASAATPFPSVSFVGAQAPASPRSHQHQCSGSFTRGHPGKDSLHHRAPGMPYSRELGPAAAARTRTGPAVTEGQQQQLPTLEAMAAKVLDAQICAVSSRRAPLDTLLPGSQVQALDEGTCVWRDAVVRGTSPAGTCLEVGLEGSGQIMRVPAEGVRGRPRGRDPHVHLELDAASPDAQLSSPVTGGGRSGEAPMPWWSVARADESDETRAVKLQHAREWEARAQEHQRQQEAHKSLQSPDMMLQRTPAESLHTRNGSNRSLDGGWVDPSTFWASVQQTGQELQHEHESHGMLSPVQRTSAWVRELLQRARARLIVTGRVLLHDPWAGIWPVVVLIVLMGLGLWGVYNVAYSTATHKRDESLAAAQGSAQDLIMRLGATTAPVTAMATFIRLQPNYTSVNNTFFKVAPLLVPDSALSSASGDIVVMSLSPNGILQNLYPLNPIGIDLMQAYGLDLLKNASWRPSAMRAVELHQTGVVLSGPTQLRGGPMALSARLAIFIEGAGINDTFGAPGSPYNCSICYEPPALNPDGTLTPSYKFWGFTVLNIDWNALMRNSSLLSLCGLDGLSMRLTYMNPSLNANVSIAECGDQNDYDSLLAAGNQYSTPLFLNVDVMSNHWELAVWYETGWLPNWLPYVVAVVVMLSFLVSLLLLVVMVNRREHLWLLQAMLPKKVIETLQRGEPYVEAFSNVTVLFSDVVSYTTLASKLQPIEIVRILNEMYSAYDALVDEYGCYKVETIGDAFMVVCGTQGESAREAAARTAGLALAMVERTRSLRLQLEPGPEGRSLQGLQIRVGLHSGPVVGAVLGNKMPHLCLCGDTVNTASRMETNSAPMRVHVSGSTAELLELGNAQGIRVEPRGQIDVKGKGLMNTFWLAPQNAASRDPSRRVGAATAGVSAVDSSVRLRKSAPSARDAVGEVGLELGSREEHAGSLYDCGSGGGNGAPSTVSAEKDRFSGSTHMGGGGGGGGSTSSDTTNSNGSFRTLTTLGGGSTSHGRSRLMVDLRIFQAGGSSRGGTNSGATDASSAGQLSTSGAAQAGRRPSHEMPRVPAVAQVRLSAPNS